MTRHTLISTQRFCVYDLYLFGIIMNMVVVKLVRMWRRVCDIANFVTNIQAVRQVENMRQRTYEYVLKW